MSPKTKQKAPARSNARATSRAKTTAEVSPLVSPDVAPRRRSKNGASESVAASVETPRVESSPVVVVGDAPAAESVSAGPLDPATPLPATNEVADAVSGMIGEASGTAPVTPDAESAERAIDDARSVLDDGGALPIETVHGGRRRDRKGYGKPGRPTNAEREAMAARDGPSPQSSLPLDDLAQSVYRKTTDGGETTRTTKDELQRRLAEAETANARLTADLSVTRARLDASAVDRLSQTLAACFSMAFDVASEYRGEHWRLPGEDARALGAAWAPPLAPHSAIVADYLPWAAAVAVTYQVVAVRIREDAARIRALSPPPFTDSLE